MTGPAIEVQGILPGDTGLRIGRATVSGGITTIRVAGAPINCGFLKSVSIVDGEEVAVLRYGSTWLCLGSIKATA